MEKKRKNIAAFLCYGSTEIVLGLARDRATKVPDPSQLRLRWLRAGAGADWASRSRDSLRFCVARWDGRVQDLTALKTKLNQTALHSTPQTRNSN